MENVNISKLDLKIVWEGLSDSSGHIWEQTPQDSRSCLFPHVYFLQIINLRTKETQKC